MTLVYVAVIMLVLIGFVSLATDGGFAYLEHRRMQTAADAAALAGARAMALGGDYGAAITRSVAANHAGLRAWRLTGDGKGVHVETQATVATWLARAVGVRSVVVSATSEVAYAPVIGTGNLLPMTFCATDIRTTGETVTMRWADSTKTSGAFGWLTWNGDQSTPALSSFLRNPGLSGKWHVGDHVQSSSGTSCNPVEADVRAWIGKKVVVPVYRAASGNACAPSGTGSNTYFPIVGFAIFTMDGFSCNACPDGTKVKCTWGHFSKALMPGDVSAGGGGTDFGLSDLRLLN